MNISSNLRASMGVFVVISMLTFPVAILAQTRVVAPKNPYNEAKDVELGRQAAQQAEQKLPLLRSREVQDYVARVGRRLAEAIPQEFQHPQFQYSYKVVDVPEINAFALPGGFTYVNRGLIEAAKNEGEMAGVIAHEISHVALRHGTAQQAKAQKYQAGAVAGQILGAVIGGGAGGAVAQASQMGIGTYFLKFSREYEKQADILGAQIMANAGYDAHDLANMFKTLEQQGKSGPQWMSDHPNPGNRVDYINREADMLRVANPIQNTNEFSSIQAALRGAPHAGSRQEVGRGGHRNPEGGGGGGQPTGRVEVPSTRFRAYSGNFFKMGVPDNWRELQANDGITFAPEGAYGETQGQSFFTHGIQVGAISGSTRSLRDATDQLINALSQGNQNLRRQGGGYQRENLGQRDALAIALSNVSDVTGRPEIVIVHTALLRNGDLFYLIAVAPESDYQNYQNVFASIVRSIQILE